MISPGMKDVNYFIDKEKEYKKLHPVGLEFNEQSGEFLPKAYPDDFLSGGWFEKFAKSEHTPEMKEAIQAYNLTDSECLILQCFLGITKVCP